MAGLTGSMHNILQYVNKRDPRGPYPLNPASDSQYSHWEYGVQNWVRSTYASLLPVSPAISSEVLPDRMLSIKDAVSTI